MQTDSIKVTSFDAAGEVVTERTLRILDGSRLEGLESMRVRGDCHIMGVTYTE